MSAADLAGSSLAARVGFAPDAPAARRLERIAGSDLGSRFASRAHHATDEGSDNIVLADPERALSFYGTYSPRLGMVTPEMVLTGDSRNLEAHQIRPSAVHMTHQFRLIPGRLGQDLYSDFGAGATTLVAFPDGSSIDLTGATQGYDPVSHESYTLAADGTKVFADGTVLKPGGDIMTPGGTVVHADGSLTLPNGERIAGATPTPDGVTVAQQITGWLKAGVDVATSVSGMLGKLGIINPPKALAGQVSSGWISGTQYRTSAGAIVTPVKLPNGLYQLPDGTTVGAPPGGGAGVGLAIVGLVLGVAFAFGRKQSAA